MDHKLENLSPIHSKYMEKFDQYNSLNFLLLCSKKKVMQF